MTPYERSNRIANSMIALEIIAVVAIIATIIVTHCR